MSKDIIEESNTEDETSTQDAPIEEINEDDSTLVEDESKKQKSLMLRRFLRKLTIRQN